MGRVCFRMRHDRGPLAHQAGGRRHARLLRTARRLHVGPDADMGADQAQAGADGHMTYLDIAKADLMVDEGFVPNA